MATENVEAGRPAGRSELDGVVFPDRGTKASKKVQKKPTTRKKPVLVEPDHGVKLLSASVFWGCNIHHGNTVITQDVDLGALADQTSNRAGATFAARFIERFNTLDGLTPGSTLDGDFVERLRSDDGASFLEIVFRAILAVEAATACAMRRLRGIDYCQILRKPNSALATLVWSSSLPEISRRAAQVGLVGFTELLPDELTWPSAVTRKGFDPSLVSLLKAARRHRPLPPAAILLDAAERRGIPWEKIGGNVIRLGQGSFQHRIWSTVTSNTSRVADRLAQDKVATHRVLDDLGLPVPRQVSVKSPREARTAAEEIGYPIVVKPLGGNTGKGVSANLKGRKEIPAAFKRAREVGEEVVVESFVEGQDHRLLVVGGRVVAAALRVPPSVTGDGQRTIAELIEKLNIDPLRDNFRRARIKIDQELSRLLELEGYNLRTVLTPGESFRLRSTANVSTGGFTIDVTEELHPDNAEMAIRAAEAVGLDVAGVDFLTTDITRSYRQVGGGIVEVNSRPGLRPHIWPVSGKPRDVGGTVIETMFPPGDQGRVPVAIIAGAPALGSAVAARAAALLSGAGITLALMAGDERSASGRGTEIEVEQRSEALRKGLRDPRLEAMVRAVTLRDVARCGLLIDTCETAVVLDSGNGKTERLGLDVVIRATVGRIIGCADRALPDAVASLVGTERLLLVATTEQSPVLQRHLESGGHALVATKGPEAITISLACPPGPDVLEANTVATLPARAPQDDVELQLFALALAHSMGLSPEDIGRAPMAGESPPAPPAEPSNGTK